MRLREILSLLSALVPAQAGAADTSGISCINNPAFNQRYEIRVGMEESDGKSRAVLRVFDISAATVRCPHNPKMACEAPPLKSEIVKVDQSGSQADRAVYVTQNLSLVIDFESDDCEFKWDARGIRQEKMFLQRQGSSSVGAAPAGPVAPAARP